MGTRTALPERPPAPDALDAAAAAPERFVSARLRLDRLSTVRSGTVVVELAPGRSPLLRRPGELLLPAWSPWGPGVDVLVVSTAPVVVRVGVQQVLTLDGDVVAVVELEVAVRLVEDELLALALPAVQAGPVVQHESDLGLRLVLEVRHTVESALRAAVGTARTPDLHRQGLPAVLGERWLPPFLADGALTVESAAVTAVGWTTPDDLLTAPDTFDSSDTEDTAPLQRVRPQAPASLRLAPLGREDRHQSSRSAGNALALVSLPAVISVTVWWIFFCAYWLPELQTLPGAHLLLEQLAPLASKELTSQGEALVTGQGGHSGAPAVILLVVSLLLAPLGRSRYWLARLALWPLTYVATVAAVVAVLGVLLRGRLLEDLLGVVLLGLWVYGAVVTTWHSLWVDVDTLPRRPRDVAWLLGLFALVGPAPVALGRAVFAPQLRTAALGVLGNDAALRWAALLTPATAWVYLSGALLGVLVWAAYLLWPPRGVGRIAVPLTALISALVALAFVGPQAGHAATAQAERMRTQSPGRHLSFTCGAWTQQVPGRPVQTLVVSGLGCTQLRSFRGYVEVGHRETDVSLSPIKAQTSSGKPIEARLVAAQYGGVVVVASTRRLDRRPTELRGVRLADAVEVWRVPCRADAAVKIRFARTTDGDQPAAGRQTRRGEPAMVDLNCSGERSRVDPLTGRVR